MIFIVGGAFQGKREFAEKMVMDLQKEGSPEFADGGKVSWEVFRKARYGENLHLMIRRRLEEGEDGEELEKTMARQLIEGCPERILITDEIGYGIVPADPFERQYRELAGRIGCKLAAEAGEVWRVIAGIGKRIK